MSQNPSASRPASRSPPDGQKTALPSVQARDDLRQTGGPADRQRPVSAGRGFYVQTSPQRVRDPQPSRPVETWRGLPASRDLGVHSILNPSEPDSNRAAGQQSSARGMDSPSSVAGPSQFGVSPSRTISNPFQSLPPASTPPTAEGYPASHQQPRRILTPRSPSRSISTSGGRGRGTINAQRSPFLPTRGQQIWG